MKYRVTLNIRSGDGTIAKTHREYVVDDFDRDVYEANLSTCVRGFLSVAKSQPMLTILDEHKRIVHFKDMSSVVSIISVSKQVDPETGFVALDPDELERIMNPDLMKQCSVFTG